MDYDDDLLPAFRNWCEKETMTPEEEAMLEDPQNFYFNVFYGNDTGLVAIVTPKCLYDRDGTVCDQGTANILMDRLGAYVVMESVYDFDELYDKDGLIAFLLEEYLEHNNDIRYPY